MLRLSPTGNSTFDAAEVTAYATYSQRQLVGAGRSAEVDLNSSEIAYLQACWDAAMSQLDKRDFDVTAQAILIGSGATLPLNALAKSLATMLRNRGVTLPTAYFVAKTATIAVAGTLYAVGDVLAVTGGAKIVATTLTVATVSSGTVLTATVRNWGRYNSVPSNDVATTHSTGAGDDAATFTMLWQSLPVLYA